MAKKVRRKGAAAIFSVDLPQKSSIFELFSRAILDPQTALTAKQECLSLSQGKDDGL